MILIGRKKVRGPLNKNKNFQIKHPQRNPIHVFIRPLKNHRVEELPIQKKWKEKCIQNKKNFNLQRKYFNKYHL